MMWRLTASVLAAAALVNADATADAGIDATNVEKEVTDQVPKEDDDAAAADAAIDDAEKPAEVTDSHVLKLTNDNFSEKIGKSKYNLVKFYAPWCGHCKAMAEPYIQAAAALKDNPDIQLGDVDATVETAIASKYEIQGYPTLLWFVDGNQEEYTGPRTAEGMAEWINDRMKPSLIQPENLEAFQTSLKERAFSSAFLLFQGDDTVKTIATNSSDENRATAKTHYLKSDTNSLQVYRGQEEEDKYEGEWTAEAVKEWVSKARVPAFGQITEDNYEIYIDRATKGMFWVCLDPTQLKSQLEKYTKYFVEAAKGSDYPQVWIDAEEFEQHAKEELGCTKFPTIVLQRGNLLSAAEDTKVEQFIRDFSENPDDLNKEAIDKFFDDIKTGKLEPVPEPDELAELDDEDDEDDEEDLEDEEDEKADGEKADGEKAEL